MFTSDDQFGSLHAWTNYGGANETPWGPKLSSFLMHSQEWREAFLGRLAAVGEPALIEAASRVYDLLQEPKTYYCALIAKAAGVKGSGKLALLQALQKFLDEWLQQPPDVPSCGSFQTLRDWNQAAMRIWSSENEREAWVIKKYAAALNGNGLKLPRVLASRTQSNPSAEKIVLRD